MIAPTDEKRRKLYDNLQKEGYELPDFNTFSQDMLVPEKAQRLHSNLRKEGYDLPEFEVFRQDIAPDTPPDPSFTQAPSQGAGVGPTSTPSTGQDASLGGQQPPSPVGGRMPFRGRLDTGAAPQMIAGQEMPVPTTEADIVGIAPEPINLDFATPLEQPISKQKLADAAASTQAREAMGELREYVDKFSGLDEEGVRQYKDVVLTDRAAAARAGQQGVQLDVEQLRAMAEDLNAMRAQLEQTQDPVLAEQYNRDVQVYMKMAERVQKRAGDIEDLQANVQRESAMADKRRFEIRSEQGNFMGAAYNNLLKTVGSGVSGWNYPAMEAILALDPPEPMEGETQEQANNRARRMLRGEIRDSLKDFIGSESTTDEYIEDMSKSFLGGAWLSATGTAPLALMGPMGIGMMLAAADGVMQEMESPEFDGVPEWKKGLFSFTVGAVVGQLERAGLRNAAKGGTIVRDILNKAFARIPQGATSKEIAAIINAETNSAIANFGSRVLRSGIAEGATEFEQGIAEPLMKDLFNMAEGKQLFETPDGFGEYIKEAAYQSAQGVLAGGAFGMPYALSNLKKKGPVGKVSSDVEFETFEDLARNPEFLPSFQEQLTAQVEAAKISEVQAQQVVEDWKEAQQVVSKIPPDMQVEKRKEAFDLLSEKARLSKMEKALVADKIAAIDEKLAALAGVKPEEKAAPKEKPKGTPETPAPTMEWEGEAVQPKPQTSPEAQPPTPVAPVVEETVVGEVPVVKGDGEIQREQDEEQARVAVREPEAERVSEVAEPSGAAGEVLSEAEVGTDNIDVADTEGDAGVLATEAQVAPTPPEPTGRDAGVGEKPPSRRKLQAERKQVLKDADNVSAQELGVRGAVVRYLANGGRVGTESLIKELGLRNSRTGKTGAELRSKVWAHNKGADSIERVAEKIAASEGFDEMDVRNELIDALNSASGRNSLIEELRTYLPATQEQMEADYYGRAVDEDVWSEANATDAEMQTAERIYADAEAEWNSYTEEQKKAIFDEHDEATKSLQADDPGTAPGAEGSGATRAEESPSTDAVSKAEDEFDAEYRRLGKEVDKAFADLNAAIKDFNERGQTLFEETEGSRAKSIESERQSSKEDFDRITKPLKAKYEAAKKARQEFRDGMDAWVDKRAKEIGAQTDLLAQLAEDLKKSAEDGPVMEQKPSQGTPASEAKISKKDVANMVKALSGLFPSATVVQPKTPKEYADALKNVGNEGIAASWGVVDFTTQTIYINPASPDKRQTLYHEGAHPVLYALAISRPDIINSLAGDLASLPGGDKYKKYGEQYEGSAIQRQQEMLAELLGDVTSGKIPVSTKKDSMWQRVKRFVQDVLAALGWDMRTVDLSQPQNVRDFAREFKRAMDKGIKITGLPQVGGQGARTMLQDDANRLVDGWYSRLRETVIVKGKTMPASEWLNWMQSRAKEGSFSMEEAKWTGLSDWLTSKGKEKVTPQEVQKFLDKNRVRVEVKEIGGGIKPMYVVLDADGYDISGEALTMAEARDLAAENEGSTIEEAPIDTDYLESKFSQYQLPGGTNYREVLVTLPVKPDVYEAEPGVWYVRGMENQGRFTSRERAMSYFTKGELVDTGAAKPFRSSHFDEPNILFHLRVNDRTDADGKKVLFIEEIQSDWAQKGRKEGFAGSNNAEINALVAEERREQEAFDVAARQATEAANEFDEAKQRAGSKAVAKYGFNTYSAVFFSGNEDAKSAWMEAISSDAAVKGARVRAEQSERHRVAQAYRLNAVKDKIRKLESITPSAPFVTDTSAWVELAIKQAVRMAVEGNYDRVAWTKGQHHTDRWGTERIEWAKQPDGSFLVNAKAQHGGQAGGMDLEGEANARNLNPQNSKAVSSREQLEEAIRPSLTEGQDAKKLSEKLWQRMQSEESGVSMPRKEGFEGFYDKIVPTVAAKVIKKMGGGKVGEVSFPSEEASRMIASGEIQSVDEMVDDAATMQQPSFDITPAMRDQTGLGLALMQKPDPTKVKNMADALRGMDITTAEEVTSRMKSFGLSDTITDAVLKEMGLPTMGEAQKKVKQATGQRTMPLQPEDAKTLKDKVRLAAQNVMKGYRMGVAEGTVAGEIAGKLAGRKEGSATAKAEAKRRRQEFAEQTKEAFKDLYGKLTPAQAKSLTLRAMSTDPINPKAVSRFAEYLGKVIDNANYSEDINFAKKEQKKAKKLLGQKAIPANHKEILSRIAGINPEMLSDPKAFGELAKQYLNTFASPASPDYMMASIVDMDKALGAFEKQQVEEFERMVFDEFGIEVKGKDAKEVYDALMNNPELVVGRDAPDDMTPEERAVYELLSPQQKRTVSERLAEQAAYSQMALLDVDLEGFTPKESEMIKALQGVDVEKIPAKFLPGFIRYVDNITVNGSLAGAKSMAQLAAAIEANDLYRKDRDLSNARQVWSSKPGRLFQEQFSSVSGMFRFIKGQTKEASDLMYYMGLQEINNQKAQLDGDMRKVAQSFGDALRAAAKKNKDVNSAKNRVVEGASSWLLQQIPGMDMDQSFRANKEMMAEDIAIKKNYANYQNEAAAAEAFYSEVVEGAQNIEQFVTALKQAYPQNWTILEKMMDLGKLFEAEVLDHKEHMWNETDQLDNPYYMPKLTKRLKGEKLKDVADNFMDFVRSKGVNKPKQAGSLKSRQRYTTLPANRLIDYNIRSGFLRRLKENLYDARTSEYWERLRQFTELPGSEEVFGSLDNRDFVIKRLNKLYKSQKEDLVIGEELDRFLDSVATLGRKAAVGYALGGVTQIPKQFVDQTVNAMINTDPVTVASMWTEVGKANDLLSLGAIGERGELMGGTQWNNDLEAKVSRLNEALQNENFARAREAIKNLNNFWLASLRASDVLAARTAFLSFYKKGLELERETLGEWDNEASLVLSKDPARNKAFAYAEMMTDITQGSSDPSKLAQFSQRTGSGLSNLVKAILNPFSTFSVAIRERLVNDVSDIANYGVMPSGDASVREIQSRAARSIAATMASQIAFTATRLYIAKGLISLGAKGLLALVASMSADDEEREDMMNKIALAFEVLYTVRLMDTDAYRAAMNAQKKQAKMTALGPEYSEELEKQREAEFNWKMAYSSFLRDMLAGGMTSFAEDGLIDALNMLYYEGGLIMGFEDFRDSKGNPVNYDRWLRGKDTPLYRYGQGRDEVDYGVFGVVKDRFTEPYEAATRVLKSQQDKQADRMSAAIREYKNRVEDRNKERDQFVQRVIEAKTPSQRQVVQSDYKQWIDSLKAEGETPSVIQSINNAVKNAVADKNLDPWVRNLKNAPSTRVRAMMAYRELKDASPSERKDLADKLNAMQPSPSGGRKPAIRTKEFDEEFRRLIKLYGPVTAP